MKMKTILTALFIFAAFVSIVQAAEKSAACLSLRKATQSVQNRPGRRKRYSRTLMQEQLSSGL